MLLILIRREHGLPLEKVLFRPISYLQVRSRAVTLNVFNHIAGAKGIYSAGPSLPYLRVMTPIQELEKLHIVTSSTIHVADSEGNDNFLASNPFVLPRALFFQSLLSFIEP